MKRVYICLYLAIFVVFVGFIFVPFILGDMEKNPEMIYRVQKENVTRLLAEHTKVIWDKPENFNQSFREMIANEYLSPENNIKTTRPIWKNIELVRMNRMFIIQSIDANNGSKKQRHAFLPAYDIELVNDASYNSCPIYRKTMEVFWVEGDLCDTGLNEVFTDITELSRCHEWVKDSMKPWRYATFVTSFYLMGVLCVIGGRSWHREYSAKLKQLSLQSIGPIPATKPRTPSQKVRAKKTAHILRKLDVRTTKERNEAKVAETKKVIEVLVYDVPPRQREAVYAILNNFDTATEKCRVKKALYLLEKAQGYANAE